MPALLIVTALAEASIGVALLFAPSIVSSLLLGVALDVAAGVVLARIAGVALIALALICWLARSDSRVHPARGLLIALLFYNLAALAVLLQAHFGLALSGIGFWPAVAFHFAMAGWCVALLKSKSMRN